MVHNIFCGDWLEQSGCILNKFSVCLRPLIPIPLVKEQHFLGPFSVSLYCHFHFICFSSTSCIQCRQTGQKQTNKQTITKQTNPFTTMPFFRFQSPYLDGLLLSTLHSILIFILCIIPRIITYTYLNE